MSRTRTRSRVTSYSDTVPSEPEVTTVFPSGSQSTWRPIPSCTSTESCSTVQVRVSTTVNEPSSPTTASHLPSGEKDTSTG